MQVRGVGRRFGSNWVLEDVSLDFRPASCTALLGENGAGKSTLLKILSGQITPSAGSVLIDGTPVRLRGAREARDAGIVVIPQELAYVPHLTVAENLMIGRWPSQAALTTRRAVLAAARRIVAETGFELDLDAPMHKLPLADRQLVEIVKVIASDARLILLDEPTASLTKAETDRLLEILDQIRANGTALVYVSHHIDECLGIADRFAVLRSGRLVATPDRAEADTVSLVGAMLGEAVDVETRPAAPVERRGEPRLVLRDWRAPGVPGVKDLSLVIGRSEIVVLFGLLGSGVEAIARALGGAGEAIDGEIEIDGRRTRIFSSPRQAWSAGVAYVPAERKRDGLVLSQSIRANLALHRPPSRFGWLLERRERRWATETARRWQVRHAGVDAPVGELSGGNQQRVLLASRLTRTPRVLVVHEPTRGVDIGARLELHEQLRAVAAEQETAILAVTSDVDEAVALGERIVVVGGGRVVAELTADRRTPDRLLSLAGRAEVAA